MGPTTKNSTEKDRHARQRRCRRTARGLEGRVSWQQVSGFLDESCCYCKDRRTVSLSDADNVSNGAETPSENRDIQRKHRQATLVTNWSLRPCTATAMRTLAGT